MAAIVDVAARFRRMLLRDPVFQAVNRGEMDWADVLDYEQEIGYPVVNVYKPTPLFDSLRLNNDDDASSVTTSIFEDEEEENDDGFEVVNTWKKPVITQITVPPFTPGIKTIITRNLPRDITVDLLRTAFEKYGPIRDIYIPKNMDKASPYFGTVKGFALIKFLKPDDSARAYTSEYGRLTINKNNIAIEFAKEDR